MAPTIPLAMFGLLPLTVWLFQVLEPRRAVAIVLVGSLLFLPNFTFSLSGLPEYNKTTAAALAILIGMLLKDSGRLSRFRLNGYDYGMLFWCLTPVFASLSNSLGLYDGLSAMKNYVVNWAFPYLIGRLYFTRLPHFRELALWILVGGLIYLPFCAAEVLLSPQLHNWVYGFHPHEFQQSIRGNSYRPVVFMKHGLMVGLFLLSAVWIGLLAWVFRHLPRRLPPLPFRPSWLVVALLLVFVASKSMGALFFLILLSTSFLVMRRFRTKLPLLLLAIIPVVYLSVRLSGVNLTDPVVDLVTQVANADRAASLEFRLVNEDMLMEKALERPVFGWGGWGRSRIYDYDGKDISVTDSLWIIILGSSGVTGLIGVYLILGLPFLNFVRQMPRDWWRYRQGHAAVALVSLLGVYLCDNLLNNMGVSLFLVISGGAASALSRGPALWEDSETPLTTGEVSPENHQNFVTRYL